MNRFEYLNNDIRIDVFSRLQTKHLVQLECVCKGWHELISDRSFIKVQSQKREPLSGFFFQQRYEVSADDMKTINYISVVTEAAELQQRVFSFLPEDVVVLSSCNGLVCCRSCFPFLDSSLYICNPLNKDWIRLSWENPGKEDCFALVFDPVENSSTDFKIVRVHHNEISEENFCFSFEIYSSTTGVWRTLTELRQCNDKLFKNKCAFVEGMLHWLTDGNCILTFHPETEQSMLFPVPATDINHIRATCLGESNGKLYYVIVSGSGLQIWCLLDRDDMMWELKHSKTLQRMEEENPRFLCNLHTRVTQQEAHDSSPWMDPLAFKDGWLLMRVSFRILKYNVETNQISQACTLQNLGSGSMFCPTVLPYSLSLVRLR